MPVPEVTVRNLLNNNQAIVDLMDKIRGSKLAFPPIFTTTPTDKFLDSGADNAPWIRVTLIPGDEADYADDERIVEYPRVQVDFWIRRELTQELAELEALIYSVLHEGGYERYYKNHEQDTDIETLMMIQGNFQGFD
ncbi:hypothetical protein [Loigolactobacillus coryniformis]|uniref:hypothetical protein n=1 Tax=Loigolactobacillus coryniformis TaxID=1610 RepID=UPI003F51B1DF